jgi:hypothetical protein
MASDIESNCSIVETQIKKLVDLIHEWDWKYYTGAGKYNIPAPFLALNSTPPCQGNLKKFEK